MGVKHYQPLFEENQGALQMEYKDYLDRAARLGREIEKVNEKIKSDKVRLYF